MSNGGKMPAVGDKVWVETAGTYEELATVLNVDVEMDEAEESSGNAAKRVATDGILVELYDSKLEIVISPSDISRPFQPSSPRKTRSQRQVVTPSPTTEQETSKPRSKRKRTTPAKPAAKNKDEPELTESPHFGKKNAAAPTKKKKKKAEPKKAPAKKPAAAKSKKASKVQKVESIVAEPSPPDAAVEAAESSDKGYSSGEDESVDLDRPFQVEYSATGRATCKRCDEKIAKGALRVSHVPLFRGKVRTERLPRRIYYLLLSDLTSVHLSL